MNILDIHTSQLASILGRKNSDSLDTYVETLEISLLDELVANAVLRFLLLETQGEQHHERAVEDAKNSQRFSLFFPLRSLRLCGIFLGEVSVNFCEFLGKFR